MISSTRSLGTWRVDYAAVDVGLAALESKLLVKAVRSLTLWSTREVDASRARERGQTNSLVDERAGDPAPASVLVDDDVFDPGAHARGDHERRQCAHAENLLAVFGDEEDRGGGVDDSREGFVVDFRGFRELRQQPLVGSGDLVTYRCDLLDHRRRGHGVTIVEALCVGSKPPGPVAFGR
jgi:hypothetical protein